MNRKFFDKAIDFLENRLIDDRSHYLIGYAAVELCEMAINYGYFIEWYECGLLHVKNQELFYEGHDTWKNLIDKSNSYDDFLQNNRLAAYEIQQDMGDGYNVFAISLKKIISSE